MARRAADLGYGPPRGRCRWVRCGPGALDRDALAETVLSRVAIRRSAWNPADIRGEAEQALARAGLMADASIRVEVAEDITARAVARSVPWWPRGGAGTCAGVDVGAGDRGGGRPGRPDRRPQRHPSPGGADLDAEVLDGWTRAAGAVALLAGGRALVWSRVPRARGRRLSWPPPAGSSRTG